MKALVKDLGLCWCMYIFASSMVVEKEEDEGVQQRKGSILFAQLCCAFTGICIKPISLEMCTT